MRKSFSYVSWISKKPPHSDILSKWKRPQLCQNLCFPTVCLHFHFWWDVPEDKEGWKSKYFNTSSYTQSSKSKSRLPSALPRHFTSCLVCLCKSQEDLLAPARPWLSSREWWSSCVPCLCSVPSGQDYSPWLFSHRSMRAYATTAASIHWELRVDFKP